MPGVPAAGNDMQPGELLTANSSIMSISGRFRLTYQDDGNLVLYRAGDGAALWDIRPQPGGPGECIMQGDGNLVAYNAAAAPVWASNTDGNPGARLILQDDGNLVIYRTDGTPLWASNTAEGVFRFDLTQVNGWIQLELHRDGTVHFSGHAHNDALISESVQYTVRVALGLDTVAVLQHSANLAGLGGTPQERNDYWDETFVRPDVQLNYDALVAGKFQVFEYRKGAILGEVVQMLDFLRGAVIGILIPPELGLVLFLGGEIAGPGQDGEPGPRLGDPQWHSVYAGPVGLAVRVGSARPRRDWPAPTANFGSGVRVGQLESLLRQSCAEGEDHRDGYHRCRRHGVHLSRTWRHHGKPRAGALREPDDYQPRYVHP
jgi:hypothetical protein